MSEDMQKVAIQVATEAMQKHDVEKDVRRSNIILSFRD